MLLCCAQRFAKPVEVHVQTPVVRGARAISEAASFLQAGSVSLHPLHLFAVFPFVVFVR